MNNEELLRKVNWSVLKSIKDSTGAPIQYIDLRGSYAVWLINGPFTVFSVVQIKKEIVDFEQNYRDEANISLMKTDTDLVTYVRPKISKFGWAYQIRNASFETAKLSSLLNLDEQGSDIGDITLKFFDDNLVELTAGTQIELDTNCRYTQIEFEPLYDYEMIGGRVFTDALISNDVLLNAVLVPDISAPAGGSFPMIQNLNLRFVNNAELNADGRISRLLEHDATFHTNKVRVLVKHPLLSKNKIQMAVEHYRPWP